MLDIPRVQAARGREEGAVSFPHQIRAPLLIAFLKVNELVEIGVGEEEAWG